VPLALSLHAAKLVWNRKAWWAVKRSITDDGCWRQRSRTTRQLARWLRHADEITPPWRSRRLDC